ncbi:MAG TPA: hypothetical protein VF618_09180 [Thermoanaerobaculia bacterium]
MDFKASVLPLVLSMMVFAGNDLAAQSSNGPKKHPWEYTLDERLALRFSATAPGRVRTESGEERQSIVGADHPEFFTPEELFSSLIDGCYSVGNEEFEAACRRRRAAKGLELGFPADFWQVVEREAAEYITEMRVAYTPAPPPDDSRSPAQLERKTDGQVEREAQQAEADFLRVCRAGRRSLDRLRRTFGATEFDRFLYEAVAPNIAIGRSVSAESDRVFAETLRKMARGCP